jgi:hypothetical protein
MNVSELKHSQEIYKKLTRAYHISKHDIELYNEMANFEQDYTDLFKLLGFELIYDHNDFYYLAGDDKAALGTGIEKAMILIALLAEYANEIATDPSQFFADEFDSDILPTVLENGREVLSKKDINNVEDIEKILSWLAERGFLYKNAKKYVFLKPTHRFLDVLSEIDKLNQENQS